MTLPLSESIRLGALLRPQANGLYLVDGGTCAIGAALDAVGQLERFICGFELIGNIWPLLNTTAAHPISGCLMEVFSIITNLNDGHGWTRERIADWVEQIEQQAREPGQAVSLLAVGIDS